MVPDPRITGVLAAIDDAPARRLTVGGLAAEVGLSRSRLEHLFREQTGETLRSHLRRLRMTRAQLLLADLTLSIKEIAAQCGYSSGSHFAKDFKRTFHVSPTQYRRRTS